MEDIQPPSSTFVRNPYAKKSLPKRGLRPLSPCVEMINDELGVVVGGGNNGDDDAVGTQAETNHHHNNKDQIDQGKDPKDNATLIQLATDLSVNANPDVPASQAKHQQTGGTSSSTGSPSTNLSYSFQVPFAQRLPSKMITFTSAEILTIPEVIQMHNSCNGVDGGCICSSSSRRRSIRVMGVLRHQHMHADGSISLLLTDPLAPLQRSILKTNTKALPPPLTTKVQFSSINRNSFSGTTSSNNNCLFPKNKHQTPKLVYKRRKISTESSSCTKMSESKLSCPATQPSSSLSQKHPLISSLSTSITTTNTSNIHETDHVNDQPSNTTTSTMHTGPTAVRSLDVLVQQLQNNDTKYNSTTTSILSIHPCVWVVVPSDTVVTTIPLQTNDLITILGEINYITPTTPSMTTTVSPINTIVSSTAVYDSNNSNDVSSFGYTDAAAAADVATSFPSMGTQSQPLLRLQAITDVLEEFNSTTSPPSTIQYIQARIVRNVNGTNVQLYTESLQKRRKYMQQQQSKSCLPSTVSKINSNVAPV